MPVTYNIVHQLYFKPKTLNIQKNGHNSSEMGNQSVGKLGHQQGTIPFRGFQRSIWNFFAFSSF